MSVVFGEKQNNSPPIDGASRSPVPLNLKISADIPDILCVIGNELRILRKTVAKFC